MSSINTPSPTGTLTVTRKVFDLDSMTKVKKSATYEAPVAFTTVEDLSKVDDKELLDYVNKGRARQAKLTAKKSIVGADPTTVNNFYRGFRSLPMYMVDAEGKVVSDPKQVDTAKQTSVITAFLVSSGLMEGLKQAAIKANETASVEEDDEEGEDEA